MCALSSNDCELIVKNFLSIFRNTFEHKMISDLNKYAVTRLSTLVTYETFYLNVSRSSKMYLITSVQDSKQNK